jgi:hypothetical protein
MMSILLDYNSVLSGRCLPIFEKIILRPSSAYEDGVCVPPKQWSPPIKLHGLVIHEIKIYTKLNFQISIRNIILNNRDNFTTVV